MKTLVLGDIHGRRIWKDLIEKENPDRVIFLGDYVSTHEGISSDQQIEELYAILDYKENNPDKVILLRGNHDMQHLGYYWARCSGLNQEVYRYMSTEDVRGWYLSLTQWIYIDEELKTIFSHAGISQIWLEDVEKYLKRHRGSQYDDGTIDEEVVLDCINSIEPCELFGFISNNPFDMCGESETQPPTWIRPYTLATCNILGWDQVVGHTPQRDISKMSQNCKGKQTLWFCDSLGFGNYLVIENGEFIPKHYEKEDSQSEVLR